jgi:methylmalonyl-CoA mutase
VTDGGAALTLAAEFPPAARDDWLTLVGDVEPLRSATYDGITLEPLYTAADELDGYGLPGFAPFVRGRTAVGTRDRWDVRQVVDASQGRGAAAAELERGATSVWLRLGHQPVVDERLLSDVLDGVLFDVAPITLDAGRRWVDAARALVALWKRERSDPAAVTGSFGADPYGEWATHRDAARLDSDLQALVLEADELAGVHPGVRVVTIDGTRFHDLGASDAQELGYAVAVAVATLRALPEHLDLATSLGLLEVRLAATVDQFATIAKFRAARQLLSRVADVTGDPAAAGRVPLHAVTSRAMTTRYDPAVNMLRSTVACFAAAVGGADAITVVPHDALVRTEPSELGRRLARNTHSVLAMESSITRVIDPAGGSWYVERLSDQLAERAWDVVQEIEAGGGFRDAVASGIVDERIAATRTQRAADVDHRRAPIIGVSGFPNVAERAPSATPPRDDERVVHRWAEPFETLRERVDAVASTDRRPAVFLATVGTPATFTRATAATNFFGIAGIETPRGPVTDDAVAIVAAFAACGTPVACICAADDIERERGDELRAALATAGATRIYSAARLPIDARAELADLLEHLGIP